MSAPTIFRRFRIRILPSTFLIFRGGWRGCCLSRLRFPRRGLLIGFVRPLVVDEETRLTFSYRR